MKTTFIYNPDTHISVCEITKGNHTYVGTVGLYPEDADIVSSFAGCTFAEVKAKRKMYKSEIKDLKKELKTLQVLYSQIEQLKSFPDMEHTQLCQFIRKQIRIKEGEVASMQEIIDNLTELYPQMVENRLAKAREIPAILENRKAIAELGASCE